MKLNTRILFIGIVCLILANTLRLNTESRIENMENRSEKKDDIPTNSTDSVNSSNSTIDNNLSSNLTNVDIVPAKLDNSSDKYNSSNTNETVEEKSNENKNLTTSNDGINITSNANTNTTLSENKSLNISNNLNDTTSELNRTKMEVVYIDMRNISVSPNPEVPEGPVVADIITTPKDPVITPEHKEPEIVVESTDRAIDLRKSSIAKEGNKVAVNSKEEKKADRTSKKQDGLVTPKIENSPKPQVPQYNFEPVRYVKEISSAGKAALELQESPE